jgi:hypothetical protein
MIALPWLLAALSPVPDGAVDVVLFLAFASGLGAAFGYVTSCEYCDYAAARSHDLHRRFEWRKKYSNRRYLALSFLGESVPLLAVPVAAGAAACVALGKTPFAGAVVTLAYLAASIAVAPTAGFSLSTNVVGVFLAYNADRAAAPGVLGFSPAFRDPAARAAWLRTALTGFALVVFNLQTLVPTWPAVQRQPLLPALDPFRATPMDYTAVALTVVFQAVGPGMMLTAALAAAFAGRWSATVEEPK